MKKYIRKLLLLFHLLAIFSLTVISCKNSFDNQNGKIRISLTSPVNEKIEAKVFIEGDDGNIINGAVVSVRNSSNTVTILDYNFQNACYYKLINKNSAENYTFTISSKLFDSPQIITVPHTYLTDSIDVKTIEMVNKIGESYQNYDSLNTAYPIQITWASSVEDCTYKITIRTPSKILYESSTNNKTLEIPVNVIPAGTTYVYLQIQQQKSYGDIIFKKDNFYSVSVYQSGSISFNVQ